MNTLEIAKAITSKDIDEAKLLHFTYKCDARLDGQGIEIKKVCKEKGISIELANTVFALTYARLKNDTTRD